jgi:hypothetical protein
MRVSRATPIRTAEETTCSRAVPGHEARCRMQKSTRDDASFLGAIPAQPTERRRRLRQACLKWSAKNQGQECFC